MKKGRPVLKRQEHYILCRSDKNTKNRHVMRNHNDVVVDEKHGFYEFIIELNHNEALRLASVIDGFTEATSSPTSSNGCNKPSDAQVKNVVPTSLSLEKGSPSESVTTKRTVQSLLSQSNNQTTLSVKAPGGSNQLDHLSLKIDLLTKSVDKMTDIINEKRGINEFGPFVSLGKKNFEESLKVVNEWGNVENITQAVSRFSSLSFFVGNSGEQLSILRCEVCFRYLTRDPYSEKPNVNDVLATARKGIGRYFFTFTEFCIRIFVIIIIKCPSLLKLKELMQAYVLHFNT